ncbi:major facilitator superfamily domain-containing protein [Xylariaceae sp. FL0594]|nr:major facilitator superfamily domain-containing protein [Xylariaceae sp. FL0594]
MQSQVSRAGYKSAPGRETAPLLGQKVPSPSGFHGTFANTDRQLDFPTTLRASNIPSLQTAHSPPEGGDHSGTTDGSPSTGRPEKPAVNLAALSLALAIGIFLVALDHTLTIATYGKIGSELRALNSTSWIATSYFLTLTTFQPLYGKLCDIFGRKECLLFACAVFGLGCLGCGLARDIGQLCIARAISGAGGGGMNALISILVTDLVSLRDRGVWQGYINIVWTAGLSAGAPIGGLLADSVGWRWAFIAQCPLSFVGFAAVYLVLDLPQNDSSHWSSKLRRIDFAGAATLVTAVFSLLFGLDNGSNQGWGEKVTIVPLALAPVLFAIFLFVEARFAKEPFAPGHVIFDPSLLAAYIANFFGAAAQMGILFFIALFFQAAMGMSATRSGLMFLPNTICGLLGSLGGGLVLRQTGRYYHITVAGYLLLLLGIVAMRVSVGAQSAVGVVAELGVVGLGAGTSVTTTLVAIIANAAPEDTAVAIACSYLFRSLGTTLGISISTATMQQALRSNLARELGGADRALEIEQQVRLSLEYIRQLDPAIATIVRRCYGIATQRAIVPSLVFIGLAILSSLVITERKLN